jgi:hypothetical protein
MAPLETTDPYLPRSILLACCRLLPLPHLRSIERSFVSFVRADDNEAAPSTLIPLRLQEGKGEACGLKDPRDISASLSSGVLAGKSDAILFLYPLQELVSALAHSLASLHVRYCSGCEGERKEEVKPKRDSGMLFAKIGC